MADEAKNLQRINLEVSDLGPKNYLISIVRSRLLELLTLGLEAGLLRGAARNTLWRRQLVDFVRM